MTSRHKVEMGFAWASVVACWFGCMALLALLVDKGFL
jgi:hypothetical protein